MACNLSLIYNNLFDISILYKCNLFSMLYKNSKLLLYSGLSQLAILYIFFYISFIYLRTLILRRTRVKQPNLMQYRYNDCKDKIATCNTM